MIKNKMQELFNKLPSQIKLDFYGKKIKMNQQSTPNFLVATNKNEEDWKNK
jgi:hypothetical protein